MRTRLTGNQTFGQLLFRDVGAVVGNVFGNRVDESQDLQFHAVYVSAAMPTDEPPGQSAAFDQFREPDVTQ